jgi:hypothetical protein
MGISRISAAWDLFLEVDSEKQIEILEDRVDSTPVPANVIRIVILQEPFFELVSHVMKYPHTYSYVFTYHQEILDNNPKSRFFLGNSTWVGPRGAENKRFAVSTVVGGKTAVMRPGYDIRHELWRREKQITIPKEFYLSSENKFPDGEYASHPFILKDVKQPMFDCMFHIAIENVYLNNHFTEKLIDCFYTHTIPIHWGTPNIGDYFNKDGMFEVNNLDEMVAVCNSLTPGIYQSKLEVIEENYQRVLEHTNYVESLRRTIKSIL